LRLSDEEMAALLRPMLREWLDDNLKRVFKYALALGCAARSDVS
jgi:hypothetical protein